MLNHYLITWVHDKYWTVDKAQRPCCSIHNLITSKAKHAYNIQMFCIFIFIVGPYTTTIVSWILTGSNPLNIQIYFTFNPFPNYTCHILSYLFVLMALQINWYPRWTYIAKTCIINMWYYVYEQDISHHETYSESKFTAHMRKHIFNVNS